MSAIRHCCAVQIHLTYVSDSYVTVSWATGASSSTAGAINGNALSKAAVPASNIMHGNTSSSYTLNARAVPATNTFYTQIYNFSNANPSLNYSYSFSTMSFFKT